MIEKYPKQTGIYLLLFFLIIGLTGFANAEILNPEKELNIHIATALQNNPGLREMQNRIVSAEMIVSEAGVWQDPTIGFGMMNLPFNSFDFNQEPMTGAWINVSQVVPLTDKFKVLSEIADVNLEKKEIQLRKREILLIEKLIQTWYQWAFLNKTLMTHEKNASLIENFIEVARSKYETGKGMQQDILRAETKYSKLEDKIVNVRQSIQTTGRKFAILIGNEPIDTLQAPENLPTRFNDVDEEAVFVSLFDNNPEWLESELDINAASNKVELSRRSLIPDLKLGAGYGFRQNADNGMERPDFFTLSAGMKLPLHKEKKQNARVRQMTAELRAAEFKQKALELDLKFRLQSLIDQDNRLANQILLHDEGILPQSEATLTSSVSSFSTGRVNFESILIAEANLFSARLDRLARIRDRLLVRASIAALIDDQSLIPMNNPMER